MRDPARHADDRIAEDGRGGGRDVYDGRAEGDAGGVLTLVCFKCGTEYYFGEGDPPEAMSCEKCGNTVFRSFFSADEEDEVAADFRDSTERDLRPDDPEGDTRPGDVIDLNPG